MIYILIIAAFTELVLIIVLAMHIRDLHDNQYYIIKILQDLSDISGKQILEKYFSKPLDKDQIN